MKIGTSQQPRILPVWFLDSEGAHADRSPLPIRIDATRPPTTFDRPSGGGPTKKSCSSGSFADGTRILPG